MAVAVGLVRVTIGVLLEVWVRLTVRDGDVVCDGRRVRDGRSVRDGRRVRVLLGVTVAVCVLVVDNDGVRV